MRSAHGVRLLEPLRVGYGAALLLAPTTVLHGLGAPADRRGRVVVRILGARHVVQGLASGWRPSPEVLAMGVWVDAVHAVSAGVLALVDRDRRSIALLDGSIAAAWATAGRRDLTTGRVPAPAHQSARNALARQVLQRVPGGAGLLARARADRRTKQPSAVVGHLG